MILKNLRESKTFRAVTAVLYLSVFFLFALSLRFPSDAAQRVFMILIGVTVLADWLLGWVCTANLISVLRHKEECRNWQAAAQWNVIPALLMLLLVLLLRNVRIIYLIPVLAIEFIRGTP